PCFLDRLALHSFPTRRSSDLTLSELARGDRLPTALYLAGGGSALPEVREQLEAFPWGEKLPFARTPTITVLRPVDVRGIYDSTGLPLDQQDITPMGLAFHAIQQEGGADGPLFGLMRKALNGMKGRKPVTETARH